MRLVAVVRRLVRAIDGDAQVVRLGLRELRELDTNLRKVGAGDLLVELLGQDVDAEWEVLGRSPERDLREDLVCEGARHDEGGVASRTSEVDETARGEEDNVAPRLHGEAVDLGLDIHTLLGVVFEPSNVDLNIEVADASKNVDSATVRFGCGINSLANNSILRHNLEVLRGDNVPVTGGGDEDV